MCLLNNKRNKKRNNIIGNIITFLMPCIGLIHRNIQINLKYNNSICTKHILLYCLKCEFHCFKWNASLVLILSCTMKYIATSLSQPSKRFKRCRYKMNKRSKHVRASSITMKGNYLFPKIIQLLRNTLQYILYTTARCIILLPAMQMQLESGQ